MMRRRFRNQDPEQAVADGLALYDSKPLVQATAGDPTIRAALAELKGTIGERALRYLQTTKRTVRFVYGTPSVPGAEAEAGGTDLETTITVGDELRTERPATLAGLVFHELLHQESDALFDEEFIASALQQRVMMEMLRDVPEVLTSPTRFNRGNRWEALGQLNTRVGTEMTLIRSEAPIFPGTDRPTYRNLFELLRDPKIWEHYAGLAIAPTPGHPTLTAALWSMANGDPSPSPAAFDNETIAFIDTHAGLTSCDQLVMAGALGLLPRGSTADRSVKAYIAGLPR